jgi:hypothetical protein
MTLANSMSRHQADCEFIKMSTHGPERTLRSIRWMSALRGGADSHSRVSVSLLLTQSGHLKVGAKETLFADSLISLTRRAPEGVRGDHGLTGSDLLKLAEAAET